MVAALFFGVNPPFFGGPQNILSRQEDQILIKNDILQLLFTVPGERVMRPTFGVPLRNFVFEQSTDADITTLQGAIILALAEFEPRVTIDDLSITKDDINNGINIKLIMRLVRDPKTTITIDQFLAKSS